jgi:2-hydroxychromene-2-carboxylate isomerase
MWRDLERVCADLSIPFRRPEPFPQNSVLGARVALVGLAETWGEDFCDTLFRAQFGEGRRIDEPATITDALAGMKVSAAPVLATAQSDAIKSELRRQTEEAQRLGIFGAPSFITADGELFWGNDRLERALLWATQRQ